ncbi:MAG TPA: CsbD family protein [Syntrophorhabdaceae bacterium]|nr:CsbD family protein [Syntrophorhabdaceae bacterium]
MKSSNQDKVQGTFHETKGKIKEMVGQITDNPKFEAKGKAEKIAGKAQGEIGKVKKVVGK